MKAVMSIGGSVLLPDLEDARIEAYASVVAGLAADGWTIGAVVGGGPVARNYIERARHLGDNEIALDQLGIDITRINARLLLAGLGEVAHPEPVPTYQAARTALRSSSVCVMGGVAPAQTTDAVSAALAEFIDADLLILATSVPGVFDRDPNRDDTATQFDSLTPHELVDVIADIELMAGSSAPVDILAAKIIERSGTRTIVMDGSDPRAVEQALRTGSHSGTDIVPSAGATDPEFWDLE